MLRTTGTLFAVLLVASLAFGADPTGTWKMTAEGPDGNTYKFDLMIKSDNGALTGTAANADGTIPLQDVAFKESELSFQLFYDPAGMITFKLKLDGNALKGTLTTQDGDTGTVTGAR